VRGDSVRDRYAKGLALLGLALLAGAGALVDYWPTRGQLPLAPPAERRTGLPAVTEARDPLAIDIAPPVIARRVPRVPTSVPTPVLHVSLAPRVVGWPVVLAAPSAPAPEPVPTAPVAVLASAGRPASFGGESLILPPPASPRPLAAQWAPDADEDSFLTGTVKRTGASILRGGAKAGASVLDAVRSFGGAVRRALPD
jgi:hypothetical protein